MDTPTPTRHSRWLPIIVGLLAVIVALQVALLFQRQTRVESPFDGFRAEAPRLSWWDRAKARLWPTKAAAPIAAAPLTPDTVWDDFHRMEHMRAQINRMFEEAFQTPATFAAAPATASNAEAGGNIWPDPLRHIQSMRRQIDAMFTMARSDPGIRRTGFDDGWAGLSVTPGLTVIDTGDTYEITVPLPGFDKSSIRVTLDGSLLDIVGERRQDADSTNRASTAWSTHSASRFERRLLLPQAAVRPGDVRATFRDDVLRVSVPKSEPKEIDASQVPVI